MTRRGKSTNAIVCGTIKTWAWEGIFYPLVPLSAIWTNFAYPLPGNSLYGFNAGMSKFRNVVINFPLDGQLLFERGHYDRTGIYSGQWYFEEQTSERFKPYKASLRFGTKGDQLNPESLHFRELFRYASHVPMHLKGFNKYDIEIEVAEVTPGEHDIGIEPGN